MYTAPFASNSSSSKALNPTIQGHRKRPSDCLNDLDALHLSSVTPVNGSTSQGTDAGQVSKKMKDTSDGAKLPQVTPLAAKSAQHLQLSAKEVEELKATAQKFGLLPHQEEVLTKILKKDNNGEGLILAHQAGLGKTRTSLSFLFHLASTEKMKAGDHALILAPNNDILKQWQKEHATLSGMSGDNSLSLLSYTGADRNKKLEKAVAADKKAGKITVILTTYDTFRSSPVLQDTVQPKADPNAVLKPNSIKAIIADEGDILRNKGTETHKKLANLLLAAPHKVVATASPLQNNFSDLINQVKLLAEKPEKYTELEGALKQLFKAIKDSYKIVQESKGEQLSTEDLKALLMPFEDASLSGEQSILATLTKLSLMTRSYVEHLTALDVSKRDDFSDKYKIKLPSEPVEVTVPYKPFDLQGRVSEAKFAQMTKRQNLDNTDTSALGLFNLGGSKASATADKGPSFLAAVSELKLLADIPQVELSKEHKLPAADMRSPKIDALCDQLIESFKHEDTALVMVDFSEKVSPVIIKTIQERLAGQVEVKDYSGKASAKEKNDSLEWFKAPVKSGGPKKVLVLASKAGERGLNLQHNNHVYLFNGDFNPEKERQKIGRSNRTGQEQGVTVFRFSGLQIEDKIKEIKMQKEALIKNTWKMDPSQFLKEMLTFIISENGKNVASEDKAEFANMLKGVLAQNGPNKTEQMMRMQEHAARAKAKAKAREVQTPQAQAAQTTVQDLRQQVMPRIQPMAPGMAPVMMSNFGQPVMNNAQASQMHSGVNTFDDAMLAPQYQFTQEELMSFDLNQNLNQMTGHNELDGLNNDFNFEFDPNFDYSMFNDMNFDINFDDIMKGL
ncbi:MAG: DEAD/DEAH box helicase [Pseudomonadota bacterium]|nr:DEAD/DEAH box helicase [Pseudomonadota bacterium]